jgi:hypothetical protein
LEVVWRFFQSQPFAILFHSVIEVTHATDSVEGFHCEYVFAVWKPYDKFV